MVASVPPVQVSALPSSRRRLESAPTLNTHRVVEGRAALSVHAGVHVQVRFSSGSRRVYARSRGVELGSKRVKDSSLALAAAKVDVRYVQYHPAVGFLTGSGFQVLLHRIAAFGCSTFAGHFIPPWPSSPPPPIHARCPLGHIPYDGLSSIRPWVSSLRPPVSFDLPYFDKFGLHGHSRSSTTANVVLYRRRTFSVAWSQVCDEGKAFTQRGRQLVVHVGQNAPDQLRRRGLEHHVSGPHRA